MAFPEKAAGWCFILDAVALATIMPSETRDRNARRCHSQWQRKSLPP